MSISSEAAIRLTRQILWALLLGIGVGLLIAQTPDDWTWVHQGIKDGLLKLLADVFRHALMLLVVPLVFFSLTSGTAALGEPSQLGRLGTKALGLYLLTTLIAAAIALSLALWIEPGAGVTAATMAYTPPPSPPVLEVLANMVPKNPVQAMAETQMLQIIVFAVLVGVAITMAGAAGKRIAAQLEDWNQVVLQLVAIVMKFAPIGVFALLARAVADAGMDTLGKLLTYFILVLVALAIQLLVVMPLMLRFIGRLDPRPWLRKMREVWLFAFATSSSNATLPVNMRVAEERLGVSGKVAAFAIPLGATVNMNGTAMMQSIAAVFVAQLYGIDLTLVQLLTIVGMATIAAIGAAGVPSAGMVMLVSVLSQVGLPVEAIGLLLSVDRLLDMARTVVNVSGDAAVACIVAKSEGQLDQARYDER